MHRLMITVLAQKVVVLGENDESYDEAVAQAELVSQLEELGWNVSVEDVSEV